MKDNQYPKLRSPFSEEITTEISAGAGMTTIKINCGLHLADIERLHDCIHDFMKTCETTEAHVNEMKELWKNRK